MNSGFISPERLQMWKATSCDQISTKYQTSSKKNIYFTVSLTFMDLFRIQRSGLAFGGSWTTRKSRVALFFSLCDSRKGHVYVKFFLNETWEHIKLRCPFKRGTTKGRGRFFHEISKEVRRNEIKSLHFDTSTAAALNYSSILFSSITFRERLQTKRICVWYQLFRPRQKVGQLFHDVPFATIYKSDCRTFQTDVILNNKRTYRTAVSMYKRF